MPGGTQNNYWRKSDYIHGKKISEDFKKGRDKKYILQGIFREILAELRKGSLARMLLPPYLQKKNPEKITHGGFFPFISMGVHQYRGR